MKLLSALKRNKMLPGELEIPKNDTTRQNFKGDFYMSNPLINLTEIELRDLCRHNIDTFESWSRRIIDDIFKDAYGSNYFDLYISQDQPLIKNEIKKRIIERVTKDPCRFPRKVDAILVEDIEYFLCRDDLYKEHFRVILEPFYSGINEVRAVIERLIPIRNKLSHGNTISVREAEQCICYTNDFIDVYKCYYKTMGKEREYNVPVFIRIKDILGTDIIRENSTYSWEIFFNGSLGPKIQFRSGDSYKLWVEVDSSFDSNLYEINWVVTQDITTVIKKGKGNTIEFSLNNKNVSYCPKVLIELTTKKEWHRFRNVDDTITLNYMQTLPPIEDTY